ncbi:hypothetical protein DFH07DRAFT_183229 [Mycena maculata]|uniref:Domain of unknown function at the cortex 1 domain-containing protein n=1 Tax=Mycena maculata TaxID=230809 RepID=A0AAD7MS51_9AGAR|nr:hypothetical protein DFH07DRAFT_183229 [Mycena maculata]
MPKLRVLAGPTPHDLTPITSLVNVGVPHKILTDAWEGEIVIFIKGFNQEDPAHDSTPQEAEYFSRPDRCGVTWSIQVQGRFLSPRSSDDVLFGNIFERPLKLPWGTGAALKFMKYIDPTLSHDLTCTASQKPWALSPLLATMPYLKHTRLPSSSCDHFPGPCSSPSCDRSDVAHPPFPPPKSITDDTSSLYLAATSLVTLSRPGTPSSSSSSTLSSRSSRSSNSKKSKKSKAGGDVPRAMNSQQRRSYFSSKDHRNAVILGPQDVITTDFCYGFLEFAPSLRLRLPGGLGFDLARYWDGQGVRFVCCERRQVPLVDHAFPIHEPECSDGSTYEEKEHEGGAGEGEDPWGRVLWCVSIEMGDEGEDRAG